MSIENFGGIYTLTCDICGENHRTTLMIFMRLCKPRKMMDGKVARSMESGRTFAPIVLRVRVIKLEGTWKLKPAFIAGLTQLMRDCGLEKMEPNCDQAAIKLEDGKLVDINGFNLYFNPNVGKGDNHGS
jgi:hypothetical protein